MTNRLLMHRKLVLLLLLSSVISLLSIYGFQIDEWRATHWLMDYEYEFVKRGAIGEILTILYPQAISLDLLTKTSIIFYILLAVTLGYFLFSQMKDRPLLAFAIFSSGFAIQQFAYDAGRFDQPILLLTLLSLIILSRRDFSWPPIYFATTLSIASLLIHEGSALISVPLVFSAILIKTLETRSSKRYAIFYISLTVSAFFLISANGGLSSQQSGVWLEYLQGKTEDFDIDYNSAIVPFSSLSENVGMTMERLLQKQSLNRFALIVVVSIPFIILLTGLIRSFQFAHAYSRLLCFLPAVSVLPLFVLGLDFYRWTAIILLNLSLITAFFYTQTPNTFTPKKWLYYTLLAMVVYSGPYGISTALVDRGFILKQVNQLIF